MTLVNLAFQIVLALPPVQASQVRRRFPYPPLRVVGETSCVLLSFQKVALLNSGEFWKRCPLRRIRDHTEEKELLPVFIMIVSLLLVQVDSPSGTPTAAQVEQAHQLLNGEWEIISYSDDGEKFGSGLVQAKLAKDGRIVVAARAFRVVNPETSETRITPFRVNPRSNPKRIEVTTRDDRTVSGIYKFDGDELIVCLENSPDAGYPEAFDAPAGSSRRLIRLRMISPKPKTEAPAELHAEALALASNRVSTPEEETRWATRATSRKPTESELTRVRELFAGKWEITSIVDDGEKR